jgi:hypothetical protein
MAEHRAQQGEGAGEDWGEGKGEGKGEGGSTAPRLRLEAASSLAGWPAGGVVSELECGQSAVKARSKGGLEARSPEPAATQQAGAPRPSAGGGGSGSRCPWTRSTPLAPRSSDPPAPRGPGRRGSRCVAWGVGRAGGGRPATPRPKRRRAAYAAHGRPPRPQANNNKKQPPPRPTPGGGLGGRPGRSPAARGAAAAGAAPLRIPGAPRRRRRRGGGEGGAALRKGHRPGRPGRPQNRWGRGFWFGARFKIQVSNLDGAGLKPEWAGFQFEWTGFDGAGREGRQWGVRSSFPPPRSNQPFLPADGSTPRRRQRSCQSKPRQATPNRTAPRLPTPPPDPPLRRPLRHPFQPPASGVRRREWGRLAPF